MDWITSERWSSRGSYDPLDDPLDDHLDDPLDDHLSLATSYLSVVITRSACFASTSSHDVMSAHNDVHIWLWLATFRTLCIISKRGHPRVASSSVASF